MNPKQLSKVRMSVSRSKSSGGRIRYSQFTREAVESWVRSGESAQSIAEQTGIGHQTVARWSELIGEKFQRVEVIPKEDLEIRLKFSSGVEILSPSIELMIETLENLK